jgi:hypothetical protein
MPTKRSAGSSLQGFGFVPPSHPFSEQSRQLVELEAQLSASRATVCGQAARLRARAERLREHGRELKRLASIEQELDALHGHVACLRAAAEILAETIIDGRPLSAVRGADLERLLAMLGVRR